MSWKHLTNIFYRPQLTIDKLRIIALKVGGPSVIAVWLFYELTSSFLATSEIFKSNLLLNVWPLVVIFIFCLFMGWMWVRNYPPELSNEQQKNEISGNEITNNDIGGDLLLQPTIVKLPSYDISGGASLWCGAYPWTLARPSAKAGRQSGVYNRATYAL